MMVYSRAGSDGDGSLYPPKHGNTNSHFKLLLDSTTRGTLATVRSGQASFLCWVIASARNRGSW